MTAPALDPTSRRILQILAADGRASYQAIADEVGLSRPAVMERVKRLEEAGYILGYHARLDRAKVGYPDHRLRRRPLPRSEHGSARSRRSQALAHHPQRARVPSRGGRGLLRPEGRRAHAREPGGRHPRAQASRARR